MAYSTVILHWREIYYSKDSEIIVSASLECCFDSRTAYEFRGGRSCFTCEYHHGTSQCGISKPRRGFVAHAAANACDNTHFVNPTALAHAAPRPGRVLLTRCRLLLSKLHLLNAIHAIHRIPKPRRACVTCCHTSSQIYNSNKNTTRNSKPQHPNMLFCMLPNIVGKRSHTCTGNSIRNSKTHMFFASAAFKDPFVPACCRTLLETVYKLS